MLIALDYDKTYTLDPILWDKFVDSAINSGHEVKIVTMRFPHEEISVNNVEVIYTSRKAKIGFIQPDIWIDDSPGWIYQDAL